MSRAAAAALLAVIAAGCAQVREITGGAKDDQGPLLVSGSPAPGSVRFTGDRFVMRFNERVQVKRPLAGLLVSPPIDPPPVIKLTGPREVEVRWTAPLRPGATYSFAVGEAVQDLTEGNPALGLDYAFSTGDALDSLIIGGSVAHAFSQAPQEGVLVLAYPPGDTTSFTQGRPLFATRTDKQGRFVLRHLPAQPLILRALKDLNGNNLFDLPAEEIAFLSGAANPGVQSDSLNRPIALRLFQEAGPEQRILSASITDDRAWRVVLAQPAERIAIRDLAREGGKLEWNAEWNAGRDSVLLWPSDTTALGEGRYEVSTESGAIDTLRYRAIRPMPFRLAVRALDPGPSASAIRLLASRPLAAFDEQLMKLRSEEIDLRFSIERDSADRRALLITADGALPPKATLLLLPAALRDIYGGTNDTLRIALGAASASSFGILRITVESEAGWNGGGILELLDARGLVVRRREGVRAGDRVDWERIGPGNHSLRLIIDTDGNGRWSPGVLQTLREAERVHLNSDPLQVRAGWDTGITWRIPAE